MCIDEIPPSLLCSTPNRPSSRSLLLTEMLQTPGEMDPHRASVVFVPGPKQGPLRSHSLSLGSKAQSRPRPRMARELLTHGPAPCRPLCRLPRAGWAGRAGGGGPLSRPVPPVPARRPSPSCCFPAAAAAGGAGQRALRAGSGQAAPAERRVTDRPSAEPAMGRTRVIDGPRAELVMGRACALPPGSAPHKLVRNDLRCFVISERSDG